MLVSIFFVLAGLMAMLRLMRVLGIDRLVQLAMLPLLRLTGISRDAANITVIGVTLGLTFGAGLLLRDIRSGTLQPARRLAGDRLSRACAQPDRGHAADHADRRRPVRASCGRGWCSRSR